MHRMAIVGLALCAMSVHARDPHSFANPDEVRVQSLDLELKADFKQRQLQGFVDLSLDWQDPKARHLDLDTRDLTIQRVLAKGADAGWEKTRFELAARDPVKGQRLRIQLDRPAPAVRIYYHTSPQASGLQWLTAQQTMSGAHPFLFSQSQAIHARSWVPLQDTPAVRFTYRAKIQAPKGLRVVMSADNDPLADGQGGWRFHMPLAIPSYLMAIAVGELRFQSLGPRSGVYAEPQRLAAAAHEFADTERMITAAESLYGPYRWGRYDMLVLPPSFPYGGMENPKLTFLTPTVIAGDRSLVALIAHELAHSWSGNLVTNVDWQHFWLNEGFTTYVENRIVESLYGKDVAVIQQQVDQTEMLASMREVEPQWQALVTASPGPDPDTTYTDAAYTKGAWFLRTLEERAGRARFDAFLRAWFDQHAFQSADTDTFVKFLRERLLTEVPDCMSEEELKQWLYAPGVPATARHARSERLAEVDRARARWLKGEINEAGLGGEKWATHEWLHFLNGLDEQTDVRRVAALDRAYRLAGSGNNEIAFRFFLLAIKTQYREVRPALRRFLVTVGRRKFIKPLYTELNKEADDRKWALAVYREAREKYHPVTQAAVDLALQPPKT